MIKKIKNTLLVYLVLFSLSFTMAFAESAPIDYAAIDDEADLLTQSEEEKLLNIIQEYEKENNFSVTFVTRSSIGSVDALDYADEYALIDDNANGLVFLIDMGSREYVTSTRNLAETIFNEAAFDEVDEVVAGYLSNGDYYKAFNAHLEITGEAISAYNRGENYAPSFNIIDGLVSVVKEGILVGAIFAALVAVLVNGVLKNEMNTAIKNKSASSYIQPGSFNLKGRSDRFLFQNTTRVVKPQNTQGTGGSTRVSMNSRGGSRTSRKGGF